MGSRARMIFPITFVREMTVGWMSDERRREAGEAGMRDGRAPIRGAQGCATRLSEADMQPTVR